MSDPFTPWYSMDDIAARLGFSRSWVKKLVARGEFGPRAELFGYHGDVRIPWPAIERFLRANPAIPSEEMRGSVDRMKRVRLDLRPDFSKPVVARTRGELRRKVEAVNG